MVLQTCLQLLCTKHDTYNILLCNAYRDLRTEQDSATPPCLCSLKTYSDKGTWANCTRVQVWTSMEVEQKNTSYTSKNLAAAHELD